VWASAAANMSTYLLLKERSRAFRADPEVRAALEESGAGELTVPTLGEGETWEALREDPKAFEEYDVEAAAARGYGVARIDQLMLEHLLGARPSS
jgi:xylose isomerase